ncbi:MAG: ATP-binding cassette domain-containing protein, partial [Lachnospiraceae bacterium]|nr:ATP-binding cassette domain-containing protein [Lachnospiraceae bacterium]
GEKIALIWLIGAGKTTFVKLMCGFYHPTEGEILLNDIPIDRFDRDEYYSLVSVLFQDSTMMALSLDENLTGQNPEDIDREQMQRALDLSNFDAVYEKLADRGRTMLVREINKTATDFSGGEKQRLLFARTLYQDTPLVILDEPTAALDPIAENELYLNYGRAMENKTSVYISHRLSSTRFCDRILLLEHGEIIEEGTHESLLAERTRYAELFEVQSQYYKEESERKRRSELMDDAYESGTERRGVFDE